MATNHPTTQSVDFTGLLDANETQKIGIKGFSIASNVDVTRRNTVKRRAGVTRVYTGNVDSAWGDEDVFLFMDTSTLNRLNSDYTASSLRTGMTIGGRLVAYKLAGNVYYSNGFETGVIDDGVNRTLGLTNPGRPILAVSFGSLPAGTYMVTTTFVRQDGQESGAASAAEITLSEEGGIAISNISTTSDSTVDWVNVYCTRTDGGVLYRAAQVPIGTTTVDLRGGSESWHYELRHQWVSAPPAFQDIALHNGRMLYVSNSFLYYSEAFAYEKVDMRNSFVQFPNMVTGVVSLDEGVYVGTTKALFWLGGADIKDATFDEAYSHGIVRGTMKVADRFENREQDTAFMVSQKGIIVGDASGGVSNVSEDRAKFDKALVKGASYVRELDGQNHFVSVVQY